MDAGILVQTILSGLAAGGLYALVAISFGVVYRTTRVFNFAQGDFGALGAYVSTTMILHMHAPFWVALIGGCLVVGLLAAAIERLALRPLYRFGELYTFISTLGLSFAIQNAIQMIWGPFIITSPSVFGSDPFTIAGIRIVPEKVWVLLISMLLASVLFWFLVMTKFGTAMRACAQDRRVASLLGISVDRVYMAAFALSGVVGAFAGILIAPITYMLPTMGLQLGVPGFIAALVGGLGSMPGAFIGGLVLGVVQALSVLFIDPRYGPIATYVVFLAVLLIRPAGLFGEEETQGRLV